MVLRSKKENDMYTGLGNLSDGLPFDATNPYGFNGTTSKKKYDPANPYGFNSNTVVSNITKPAFTFAAGSDLGAQNDGYNSMESELKAMDKPSWADTTAQMKTPAAQPTSYLGDAWKGGKELLGITPDAPKPTFADHTAGGGKMTEAEWTTGQNDAMRNQNQQFSNYAGAGIGAIQTGLGVLSYFDNKKMNAKNMELMDGQIANNNDIMSTRKARASDIQKYFG